MFVVFWKVVMLSRVFGQGRRSIEQVENRNFFEKLRRAKIRIYERRSRSVVCVDSRHVIDRICPQNVFGQPLVPRIRGQDVTWIVGGQTQSSSKQVRSEEVLRAISRYTAPSSSHSCSTQVGTSQYFVDQRSALLSTATRRIQSHLSSLTETVFREIFPTTIM